ncbi:putative ankyrin repeat-containing domain, PGG domain, ankyrin repeat-containing domain superfamily [Helianthus annuus]|nr:putative ankyrin repeat-containing domain, PGG domain, ankyrin repeat-containing domain superfamily [Helianthus annuus]
MYVQMITQHNSQSFSSQYSYILHSYFQTVVVFVFVLFKAEMDQTGTELTEVHEDNHPQQPQDIDNTVQITEQTGVHLASIDEMQPLSQQQQQQINIPVASQANSRPPPPPKLPRSDLFNGSREQYLKIGVPLYEASIKCDWKAAEAIFKKYPQMELIRCSITENGETALHVAASAKGSKHVEEFVKNLVHEMGRGDLELQNNNHNTALYLAAAAGNIKAVKIMLEKNRTLLTIAGSKGTMMPLYTAALFGNEDVVKYLYNNSKKLRDDGWTTQNRGWLLQKCVENDMFDVALEIVKTYPELITGDVLGVLARKPEAFRETKINIISRTINWSKDLYSKMFIAQQPSQNENPFPETKFNIIKRIIKPVPEKKNALPLLKFIWEDIAKKPKTQIDKILRGPPDLIRQDTTTVSGWAIAMQLQNLISEHVAKVKEETENIITRYLDSTDQDKVDQARQLQKLIFECLVNLHTETHKIIKGPTNSIKQDNKPISSKKDQDSELQNIILEHISNTYDKAQKLVKTFRRKDQAPLLQNFIFEQIEKLNKASQKIIIELKPAKETYSSRVLFIAAEMGNTNFLVELIRKYPDLIWKVNDDNQTIFHIAIKHRHEGIYNLLYEIGAMKDLITPLKDLKNNNMLHLVGKIAKQKRLEDVSGVALQMQRELLWFKEVKNMIPPSYRERVNEDGLTPHELFTKEHKDLVTHGEKWMKGTANQCMIVAALIATIVFAAAFTVPGGYDQTNNKTNGIPVFHSKATFMVFVVADAISLFLSCASILIFLSILTSRYAEDDFLESVPKKLISGLLTLFMSITTMTIAFGVSFFVLYHKGLIWMPILICAFGLLPVLLYIWLQYNLFSDVIRSTYRSRYLFKPHKHVLYYENPKV